MSVVCLTLVTVQLAHFSYSTKYAQKAILGQESMEMT